MGKLTLFLVVAIVGSIGFLVYQMNAPKGPGKYDSFADCLTEQGVKMYGAYWCPHCANQKRMFGGSWERVTYVECAIEGSKVQTEICQKEDIKSYPTWDFGFERITGELSFQQLAEKTGCALPN